MTGKWESETLGDLLLRAPGYGINAPGAELTSEAFTYLRITDIDDAGRFRPESAVSVLADDAAGYLMARGELVFARTGASVGKSYLYDPGDGELVYAGFLINIAPDPDRLDPRYLAQYVRTKPYWHWVQQMSARSGQPGINGKELRELPVPVPPIEEQRRIAEALDDADALIAGLERMIAKKEAVKQGMMRQLLTGRTRLPGFTAPWQTHRLGDLAMLVGGGTPSTRVDDYWGGGIPWFTPAEMAAGGSGLLRTSDRTITQEGLQNSSATLLPSGTVLVTSRASIGNCGVTAVPASTNQGFVSLIPNARESAWFLYYWIIQNSVEFETRAAGSTFLEISARAAAAIEFTVPCTSEQAEIGRVLTNVDEEIRAFRVRLEKARAIKEGMMQQLITGRTRLPFEELG